jgi:hypothetical protein
MPCGARRQAPHRCGRGSRLLDRDTIEHDVADDARAYAGVVELGLSAVGRHSKRLQAARRLPTASGWP